MASYIDGIIFMAQQYNFQSLNFNIFNEFKKFITAIDESAEQTAQHDYLQNGLLRGHMTKI
jgi:hypothetical protein